MSAPRLSIWEAPQLQALVLTLRQTTKEVQGNIRKFTREAIVPEFQKSMAEHANTRLEHMALVRNARATVSNQNITLAAGKVGRALRGGLLPKRDAHAVEFGGDRKATTTYTAHSRRGKPYQVTRHTRAQLRPRRRSGYVFYPTVADMLPRILSLWAQTTIRTLAEALEQKRG